MPSLWLRTFGTILVGITVTDTARAAQDMPVRVEAVRLLERANLVSRPSHPMPNHKIEITFRAYGLDGSTKEGQANTIISGPIERNEETLGAYHAVGIHYPDKIVQNEYETPPEETQEMEHLTPLLIGTFDESDTIHSITEAAIYGRSAKCIHFETVTGRQRQTNEICVDTEQGMVVRWHVGDELIENTGFVSFEGMLLPTHIRHYVNAKLRMEVDQHFSVIDGPIDWEALTPPNPTTLRSCGQYRRPIVESAPQPAEAGAGPWYDVTVHTVIGNDGHVYQATVFPAGRPELEQRAVEIASGWTFKPAVCHGKAVPVSGELVVHFPAP